MYFQWFFGIPTWDRTTKKRITIKNIFYLAKYFKNGSLLGFRKKFIRYRWSISGFHRILKLIGSRLRYLGLLQYYWLPVLYDINNEKNPSLVFHNFFHVMQRIWNDSSMRNGCMTINWWCKHEYRFSRESSNLNATKLLH